MDRKKGVNKRGKNDASSTAGRRKPATGRAATKPFLCDSCCRLEGKKTTSKRAANPGPSKRRASTTRRGPAKKRPTRQYQDADTSSESSGGSSSSSDQTLRSRRSRARESQTDDDDEREDEDPEFIDQQFLMASLADDVKVIRDFVETLHHGDGTFSRHLEDMVRTADYRRFGHCPDDTDMDVLVQDGSISPEQQGRLPAQLLTYSDRDHGERVAWDSAWNEGVQNVQDPFGKLLSERSNVSECHKCKNGDRRCPGIEPFDEHNQLDDQEDDEIVQEGRESSTTCGDEQKVKEEPEDPTIFAEEQGVEKKRKKSMTAVKEQNVEKVCENSTTSADGQNVKEGREDSTLEPTMSSPLNVGTEPASPSAERSKSSSALGIEQNIPDSNSGVPQ